MPKLRTLTLIFMAAALLAPSAARAGKVGGTMARYSLAGAGIGALLGAAAATVPYLTDKQPFDFWVGAGGGAMGGSVVGLIFGIVDLATDQGKDEEARLPMPESGVFAFSSGPTTYLAWKSVF